MIKPGSLALANLDFENELAGAVRALPAGTLERWRYILRLLPGMSQAECLPAHDEKAWPATREQPDELVVWGVTPRTTRLARELGLEPHFPPPEVVRWLNDKRYSHQLECQLGIALPGSAVVESWEQLEQVVAACPHDWVLKHPLGFSGRERMLGKRGKISDSAAGWARRKLTQGWTLLFEPWVEHRSDSSYHFEISPEGTVQFLGHCHMLGDPGGVYRGTQVDPGEPPQPETLQCLQQVASQLAREGYWGAVGIDSFSGRLGEENCRRPLVEINARYSFGRLALALRDWLPPDCSWVWQHPKVGCGALPPLPGKEEVRPGLYALPLAVDPGGISGTYIEVGHRGERSG